MKKIDDLTVRELKIVERVLEDIYLTFFKECNEDVVSCQVLLDIADLEDNIVVYPIYKFSNKTFQGSSSSLSIENIKEILNSKDGECKN